MRFAICSEIFQSWAPEEIFRYAARIGYEGVEIAPFTLAKYVTDISGSERARLREAARLAGVAITGIHWVLVQAEGMYLNHSDAAVRDRTSRYFVDLVDFCADLDGRVMVVGSPKQRNVMDGVAPDEAWLWATATFREAVKRAEDRAVTICFEPLAPTETNFINTAAEAVRFVRQFNSPSMKLILDVKAMCSEAKSIPQIIREVWSELAYFHANDRNLKGPGFGDVDFKPIALALREVGYSGWVSVEVFKFDEGPEVIATRSLACLREAFAAAR
jgi:sugar phosphate isomerase/epimerase